MRNRSDLWVSLAARGKYRMESKAVIGGVEYTAISSPIIDRALVSGKISVGNCISATLKLSIMTENDISKSASVVIKSRLTDDTNYTEWLEFGTFYIDSRSYDSGLLTITCYDAMLRANQVYTDSTDEQDRIGWPKSMGVVVQEIATRIGVPIDSRTVINTGAAYQCDYPHDMTMQQVLGHIGACHGGNWIITPENKLRLVPLIQKPADTFNIVDYEYNRIHTDDGYKLVYQHVQTNEILEHPAGGGLLNIPVVIGKITTGKAFTITRVVLPRDGDLGYVSGTDTGYTLTLSQNPYASQVICDDLLNILGGLHYVPFTVTNACYDPCVEMGDWVIVGDYVAGVMYAETATHGISFQANFSAPAEEELESEYPYLTEIQKLKNENEALDKYLEETKTEIDSRISQTHTSILLEVAGTYATQDAVSSSLSVLANSITAEVSRATVVEQTLSSSLTLAENSITAEVTRATNAENSLSSRITITENSIALKVSVGDVSSQISVESGTVTIGSNRLIVNSTNFSLNRSGTVTLSGSLTAESSVYKTIVNNGNISFYMDDVLAGRITGANSYGTSGGDINNGQVMNFNTRNLGITFTTGSSGYYSLAVNNGMRNDSEAVLINRGLLIQGGYAVRTNAVYFDYSNEFYGYGYSDSALYCSVSTGGVGLQYNGSFFDVHSDFYVSGTKNRVVDTDNYGKIAMSAVESAAALFSDMGSAETDNTGICFVFFDPRFLEVIAQNNEYVVFLTPTSEVSALYVQKEQGCFVVHSNPNVSFDWVVYAKQKGYATNYFERIDEADYIEPVNDNNIFCQDNVGADESQAYMDEFVDTYDEQAEQYLNDYEQEVTDHDN